MHMLLRTLQGTARPPMIRKVGRVSLLDCQRISNRFLSSTTVCRSSSLEDPPRGNKPHVPAREPPPPPSDENKIWQERKDPAAYLGTTKRLPELNLVDRVVLVSGAARGLGLVQAEALLEAGATVYCLDRLSEPDPDFYRVQKRAAEDLGGTLHYRQIDIRDVDKLNEAIKKIGDTEGRLDGLLHCAGIQQETTALDYTAKDANTMFEINITGSFMTCQAAAKQMIRFGNGGSIAMIASMSGTVANRVSNNVEFLSRLFTYNDCFKGTHLPGVQRVQGWRYPVGPQPSFGVGRIRHSRQHPIARIHCDCNDRRIVQEVSRQTAGVA